MVGCAPGADDECGPAQRAKEARDRRPRPSCRAGQRGPYVTRRRYPARHSAPGTAGLYVARFAACRYQRGSRRRCRCPLHIPLQVPLRMPRRRRRVGLHRARPTAVPAAVVHEHEPEGSRRAGNPHPCQRTGPTGPPPRRRSTRSATPRWARTAGAADSAGRCTAPWRRSGCGGFPVPRRPSRPGPGR